MTEPPADSDPARRPASPTGGESYDALGALYDDWVESVVEDVPWYRSVVRGASVDAGRAVDVVELGSGSGRVTLPIARESEVVRRIVGIEASSVQCDLLRGRLHGEPVEVVHGDMRRLAELVPPASCDVVLAPFRSLLHVALERDAVLAAARTVLRPGGVLAFDVYHPAIDAGATLHEAWTQRRRWVHDGARYAVYERARHDVAGERLDMDVRCDRDGAPLVETTMVLHVPPAAAWQQSLEAAGFDVELVVAWFDGLAWEPGDEDSVWIARAPG